MAGEPPYITFDKFLRGGVWRPEIRVWTLPHFLLDNSETMQSNISDFTNKWTAFEIARRRALYGGHLESVICHLQVNSKSLKPENGPERGIL